MAGGAGFWWTLAKKCKVQPASFSLPFKPSSVWAVSVSYHSKSPLSSSTKNLNAPHSCVQGPTSVRRCPADPPAHCRRLVASQKLLDRCVCVCVSVVIGCY